MNTYVVTCIQQSGISLHTFQLEDESEIRTKIRQDVGWDPEDTTNCLGLRIEKMQEDGTLEEISSTGPAFLKRKSNWWIKENAKCGLPSNDE